MAALRCISRCPLRLTAASRPCLVGVPRRHFAKKVTMEDGTEELGLTDQEIEELRAKKRLAARRGTGGRSIKGPDEVRTKVWDPKEEAATFKKWVNFLKPEEYTDARTPEELAMDKQFAKDYAKMCWQRTRVRKMIEKEKLVVKWQAINQLPPKLREAALIEEETSYPLTIPTPGLYPANYDKEGNPDFID